MNFLNAACDLADQGFYVFPLRAGSKKPAIKKWEQNASRNHSQIQAMWSDRGVDCNIGIAVDKSGHSVLDIDVKNGVDGYKSLEELTLFNDELPYTYQVSTPTGGIHKYFIGRSRNTASTVLGEGLDTRGVGGYVVAPGSVVPEGRYFVLDPVEIANLPVWLSNLIGVDKELLSPVSGTDITEALDSQTDIIRATKWLSECESAVEGGGGDQHTFHALARCRDFGLSPEKTLELAAEYFNPRCEPPWGLFDLQRKVDNVYKYAKNPIAVESAVADFEPIPQAEVAASSTEKERPDIDALVAADFDFTSLKPRDWILPGRLMAGFLTVTLAPGGAGKSMYTMAEAFAVASGIPLTGIEPRRTGNVLIYNTEDPLDELMRRIQALAQYYEVGKDVLKKIFIVSGRDRELVLARASASGLRTCKDGQRLSDVIKRIKADVCILDPFIRTHRVEENDNRGIDLVASILSSIADERQVAINVVHHTRKISPNQTSATMDDSRGASSLVSAARIAHVMSTMRPEEAKAYQMDDEQRQWYVRLDNAKSNMAAPAKSVVWFKKEDVKIPSGDHVGVLRLADMSEFHASREQQKTNEHTSASAHLAPYLKDSHSASITACAKYLIKTYPKLYPASYNTVGRSLRSLFEGRDEGEVIYMYEPDAKAKHLLTYVGG